MGCTCSSAVSVATDHGIAERPKKPVAAPPCSSRPPFCLSQQRNTRVVKYDEDVNGGTINISGCESCAILVFDVCGDVRINDCRQCTVFLGAVAGRVTVENSADCGIMAACKGITFTKCVHLMVWMLTNSRPIMQRCRQMKLGCLPLAYAQQRAHFAAANINVWTNEWDRVYVMDSGNENESEEAHVIDDIYGQEKEDATRRVLKSLDTPHENTPDYVSGKQHNSNTNNKSSDNTGGDDGAEYRWRPMRVEEERRLGLGLLSRVVTEAVSVRSGVRGPGHLDFEALHLHPFTYSMSRARPKERAEIVFVLLPADMAEAALRVVRFVERWLPDTYPYPQVPGHPHQEDAQHQRSISMDGLIMASTATVGVGSLVRLQSMHTIEDVDEADVSDDAQASADTPAPHATGTVDPAAIVLTSADMIIPNAAGGPVPSAQQVTKQHPVPALPDFKRIPSGPRGGITPLDRFSMTVAVVPRGRRGDALPSAWRVASLAAAAKPSEDNAAQPAPLGRRRSFSTAQSHNRFGSTTFSADKDVGRQVPATARDLVSAKGPNLSSLETHRQLRPFMRQRSFLASLVHEQHVVAETTGISAEGASTLRESTTDQGAGAQPQPGQGALAPSLPDGDLGTPHQQASFSEHHVLSWDYNIRSPKLVRSLQQSIDRGQINLMLKPARVGRLRDELLHIAQLHGKAECIGLQLSGVTCVDAITACMADKQLGLNADRIYVATDHDLAVADSYLWFEAWASTMHPPT